MTMILDKIIAQTCEHVAGCKRRISESKLREFAENAPEHASFRDALNRPELSVIAEIKKASPSKGVIKKDFDPVNMAQIYERGGASAVSVLTDEPFFQGHITYLDAVAEHVELPLLRKDFIIDPYQIYQAKCHRAAAVLLLVCVLEDTKLKDFLQLIQELGMHALVEVHDKHELKRALNAGADIVGVNNRDLKTFQVDLKISFALSRLMPDSVIRVSESGIQKREDVVMLEKAGFHACLIGESLMRKSHPAAHLRRLRGV
ncbi:MAG: indole-3-glycerol phosphate synthase TrpC [candidate division KSB1 bacterium]|nr:indole-3-glycerol phosphate synthase TrpC [candidate division KSB1 bacterium]